MTNLPYGNGYAEQRSTFNFQLHEKITQFSSPFFKTGEENQMTALAVVTKLVECFSNRILLVENCPKRFQLALLTET